MKNEILMRILIECRWMETVAERANQVEGKAVEASPPTAAENCLNHELHGLEDFTD